MKNLYRIIILLIVIITLLIITLVLLLNIDKRGTQENGIIDANDFEISDEEIESNGQETYDVNKLKNVETCIQKYYDSVNVEASRYYGRDEKIVTDEEIYANILDLLDDNYKGENNITTKNITQYVKLLKEDAIVQVLQLKVKTGESSDKYAVYGILMDMDYKKIDDFYMYVTLDFTNKAFCIEPISEKVNSFDDIKIANQNIIIKQNENNTFKYETMNPENISKYYLNRYKKIAISNPELCYEYLDNEYKEKRFETLENFKKYVQDNKERIFTARVEKYNIGNDNNFTRYICMDQNENYYIFKEKSVMDFSIILDTYTIDIPEFVETYNKAKEYEKVGLNIQKVFSAVNDGDYKYAYSKLDGTFKNNNFKTQSDFEQYIKSSLFANNKVTYKNYEQSGKIFVYTLEITDKEQKNSKTINMQVVMVLGEGTDFVMSFSII